MKQIITLCATCAGILAEGYDMKELDEETTYRVCGICGRGGYFSRYEFKPHRRKAPAGPTKRDTRAGMRE